MTGDQFQHDDKFYIQVDGVSMGNPLFPEIVYFMGILETTLFCKKKDKSNPVLYFRYVGDTFCIFQKDVFFVRFFAPAVCLCTFDPGLPCEVKR